MTVKEAYRIAKNVTFPDATILADCLDFGEFFGFGFINEEVDWYPAFNTVNKSTGETGVFNPWNDPKSEELMDNAVDIPLEEVLA